MGTVEIRDERLQYIRELAEKMSTQDSWSTPNPLYYIYEMVEHEVVDDDNYSFKRYFDADDEEVAEHSDALYSRYYREIAVPIVTVGPFLTEQGAQEYLQVNCAYYNKPFVHAQTAWRNVEMQNLLHFIFEVAGREIPSSYT